MYRRIKYLNMKKHLSLFLLILSAGTAILMFNACSEDEGPNGGIPFVSYIRVTSPESSDSLLVSAYQGSMIAIIGENLGGANQVWFNDQRAELLPTYVSDRSILTRIPAEIPDKITDMMYIVFGDHDTLAYDFSVDISEPLINTMQNEYTNVGDVAVIRGNYFYEPLTVTFTGGAEGIVLSIEDAEIIEVEVPEGAEPGPVTITSNFGSTDSDFWYKDNRNIFISNDPWTGWWGEANVVDASDAAAINGNYTRMKGTVGGWAWTEFIGGPADALGAVSQNIPDDAVLNPDDYNMKFEVNTFKPFNNNVLKIMLGQITNPDPNWDNEPYHWRPPFDTEGEWRTVTIPFNEVVANYAIWEVKPDGYGVKIWFHGPGDLDADIAFDNFRVVPKEIN
jgi:hypothetical protein